MGAVNHAKLIPARAGWLTSLGHALVDDLDASGVPFPAGDHPTLPAGYTYLGQFIDHDLTLDPTTRAQRLCWLRLVLP